MNKNCQIIDFWNAKKKYCFYNSYQKAEWLREKSMVTPTKILKWQGAMKMGEIREYCRLALKDGKTRLKLSHSNQAACQNKGQYFKKKIQHSIPYVQHLVRKLRPVRKWENVIHNQKENQGIEIVLDIILMMELIVKLRCLL